MDYEKSKQDMEQDVLKNFAHREIEAEIATIEGVCQPAIHDSM